MGNLTNLCKEQTRTSSEDKYAINQELKFDKAPTDFQNKIQKIRNRINQLNSKPLQYRRMQGVVLQPPMIQKQKKYVYLGEWKNQKPNGVGKIYFDNGQFFEGEIQDGNAQGKCRYVYSTGDYFQGNVKNNIADGVGKFVSEEIEFQGLWKQSLPSNGKFNLKKEGIEVIVSNNDGNIKWVNGNQYIGAIQQFNPHGKGTMKFKNGNIYIGDWKQGLMHGNGVFKWNDGTVYEGQYINGAKQGFGKLLYKNQTQIYEGSWKNGKKNGSGKMILQGKVIEQGYYEDGKLKEKINNEGYEQQKINNV